MKIVFVRHGQSAWNFPWGLNTITHTQANYNSSTSYSYDTSPTRGYHPTYTTGAYPYTSPVGSFPPNAYGLYDMVGNVWEWCWDGYSSDYTGAGANDPTGPSADLHRVLRGGSCLDFANFTRVSHRFGFSSHFRSYIHGFRLARGRL